MLQIKNIHKEYKTGGFVQKALDGVNLNLRENEFVAILGPSGSGKTTLLNIIGGLDRYDCGDLIINGISTKKYKDRDWDSYRNHTIGFVFQSYNLIPHQTVLANVELALTISGISKKERRQRAKKALEQVGLGQQLHKRPSQMSGGQMQRVAIARALVNDPDILLADEPTGALDSDTSVQVMELLKDVAKDRLVVMVTHNPELAEAYATRIVKLKDGQIRSDSNPFEVKESELAQPVHKNMGKSSMSFLTALSLSFNNLRTKKARTLLTSFAGSIGIIGIALILSLSNGVNAYIKNLEEETLSEYPLQIQSAGMDFSSMMADMGASAPEEEGKVQVSQRITTMLSKVDPNDLASLKQYLDSEESGVMQYANAVEYDYDIAPQIYRLENDKARQVNPDQFFAALGFGGASTNSMMSAMMNTDVFYALPENTSLYENQYEVKAGHWPENSFECVVVLSPTGYISDFMLYTMGLRDAAELDEIIAHFLAEEEAETPENPRSYAYTEFLGISFRLINAADRYEYDRDYKVWKDKSDDETYMKKLAAQGEELTIVGVVQPAKGSAAAMLLPGIGYPASLKTHLIEQAAKSEIVRQQLNNPQRNVFSGSAFGSEARKEFDMRSLFQVDEEALKNAFSFDESLDFSDFLALDNMNFGNMLDMDQLAAALPEFSMEDIFKILQQLDLSISPDGVKALVKNLAEGYGAYAATHPEADYSGLGADFAAFLQTPEARQILQKGIDQIIQSSVEVSVSQEELQNLLQALLQGYQKYAADNQLTDPDRLAEYFLQYLQTAEAQQLLADSAPKIVQVTGEITVSPDILEQMVSELLVGYQKYAVANGRPDPSKMGAHFAAYLQTPDGQQTLSQGLAEIFDSEALEAQLSKAMQGVMSTYISAFADALQGQMANVMGQLAYHLETSMGRLMEGFGDNLFQMDADAFAEAIQMNFDEKELSALLRSLLSTETTSYDGNLKKLGYADLEDPSEIRIYPKDFESKASVLALLNSYNDRMKAQGSEDKVISYTDMVGTLMSSVTQIVDIISYVLVAFVAISLIVSSIMIGVITYISVLERKKEIGILRAIGASKQNISQVFNAETFIIGLCAGLMGIGITLLLLIPANALIRSLAGDVQIRAMLPAVHGIVLIALSVILTLLGGLLPSKKAAKSDPVTALRAE